MLPKNHCLRLWNHNLFLLPGMSTLALRGLQGEPKANDYIYKLCRTN
jgi:hypothetical protein